MSRTTQKSWTVRRRDALTRKWSELGTVEATTRAVATSEALAIWICEPGDEIKVTRTNASMPSRNINYREFSI